MIEEKLADPTIPCPYICDEVLKVINPIFGQAFRAIFAAVADINEFALCVFQNSRTAISVNRGHLFR